MLCIFFFFFSSRRRHTRLVSDWSSDVCSSDLLGQLALHPVKHCAADRRVPAPRRLNVLHLGTDEIVKQQERSEERRVGKERRGQGGREDVKKEKVKQQKDDEEEKVRTEMSAEG